MLQLVLHATPKPGVYAAILDGRTIVTSKQPFYAGARVLLDEGVDPDEVLEARWHGSSATAMCSTLGEAARWTVFGGNRRGLSRVLYESHPGKAVFDQEPEDES